MDNCIVSTSEKTNSQMDKNLSVLLIMFFYSLIINNVLKRILNTDSNIILYALVGTVLVISLLMIKTLVKRSLNIFAFSITIVLLLYFFSFTFYGTSFSTIKKYLPETSIFVFFGSIAFGIKDYKKFFDLLRSNALIYVAILSLIFVGKGETVYIMSTSYLMLIPTLTHITLLFYKKKFFYLLCLVYELVFIFLVGSRGPLLVCLIFFLLCFVRFSKDKLRNTFIMFVIALVFTLIFANGKAIYEFLVSNGINSRSLMLLLTDISHDSGRGSLKDIGIAMIKENPILGWGVGGDSMYMDGGYVHSIWYELLLDFGYFGGVASFCAIIVTYLIALHRTKFNPFIMLFICFGFVPLFFSNSYLRSYEFIISLFISINAIKNPKCMDNIFCEDKKIETIIKGVEHPDISKPQEAC